ncbi:phage portal protein [uncultured Megamonas sp.]|uniref:phage portal protein n=1 Tax=uncultured Megamonas sp. TaxID=286140 RepID=UPI00259AFADA|nr:phage portal protein [uncultured Megamonas sp.]
MRKFKIDKDCILTESLILDLIKKHSKEKRRLSKLQKYYNNENTKIATRKYKNKNKPKNRLSHPYAQYITDTAVGYLLGKPVAYTTEDKNLLETITDIFRYNDEADNNTTLAKMASIYGYAYEIMYLDKNAKPRFKAIDPSELIVCYDNTLEENIVLAIRYYDEVVRNNDLEETVTRLEVYTKPTENDKGEIIANGKIIRGTIRLESITLEDEEDYYFNDIPVNVYINNDELYGDFEKVLSLIDAYDQSQSDTANDFELFTNCMLVINGELIDDEQAENLNDVNLIQFLNSDSDAKYLIKDIQDTALENYKNRLNEDIHRFSFVPNMSDENFSNNASGIAMKFKLMGLENLIGVKEAKFKKGLMRRIELLCAYAKMKNNSDYSYLAIEPVFTRNTPNNELELSQIMQNLTGILSEETIIGMSPRVSDIQAEIERKEKEANKLYEDDYSELGEINE